MAFTLLFIHVMALNGGSDACRKENFDIRAINGLFGQWLWCIVRFDQSRSRASREKGPTRNRVTEKGAEYS
jgi:hypothetical protein